MTSKPGQWSSNYAQMFKDWSVAEDYRFRPGYTPETFLILGRLMAGRAPRRVLDVGCGTGFLARELTHYADHFDAIDFSVPAIEQGKSLPGGDSPKLRWLCAPMEEARLDATYDLITAGASLHWVDWEVVMPMFGRLLRPGAS